MKDFCNKLFSKYIHQLASIPEIIILVFSVLCAILFSDDFMQIPYNSILCTFNPLIFQILIWGKKADIFFVVALLLLLIRIFSIVTIFLNYTKVSKYITFLFVFGDLVYSFIVCFFVDTPVLYVQNCYFILLVNFFHFLYSVFISIKLRHDRQSGTIRGHL